MSSDKPQISTDILVIGGSAAGRGAALSARRHYPDKKIIMIRKNDKVPVPCGIPYIYGTLESPQHNVMPDAPYEKGNIEIVIDEVADISSEGKIVTCSSGKMYSYDKLLICSGSNPVEPPVKGIDKVNVFTVRKNIEYLTGILDVLEGVEDLVVLGCGFIGVEFADECKKKGIANVTIVEALDNCLETAFGKDNCRCCEDVKKTLISSGISLVMGTRVEEVIGGDKVTAVRLSDGTEIKADALIVGIGVVPNVDLARKAGLEVEDRRGVLVDDNQRTSNPDIFACGDCSTKKSFFTGKPANLRLASIAASEARIAGANLYEVRLSNPGVVGVFSTVIEKLVVAMAGLSGNAAEDAGFSTIISETESPDKHPGKLPGTQKIWLRLIFNKENAQLIGGAVSGGQPVGELVNVIAACIQNRMTASEIAIMQVGTHPLTTASPVIYPLNVAAESAMIKLKVS